MPTKTQKFRWTAGYFSLFVVLGLYFGLLGATLPSLAAQTHSNVESIGFVFFFGALGSAIGTNLSGHIFDRVAGHPVLGVAQLVGAGLIFAIPFVPWLWLLLVIMFLKGFFDGTVNNGNNSLLVWTHKEKSAPYMNALHFFFGLGAFIAPTLFSLLAQSIGDIPGYQWAYWSIAGIAVSAGVFLLLMPESPKPVQENDLQKESNINIPVNYSLAIIAAFYLFFYVGAEISYSGWITTYSIELNIADQAGSALFASAFWAVFTIGRLISIPLAVYLKPRSIILYSIIGCMVVLLVAMLFPPSVSTVWLMSISLGFFMAPVWPMGFMMVGQLTKLTARTSGIVLLGDSIGAMILPFLVGPAIKWQGAHMLVYIVLASLVFNLLAYWGVVFIGSKKAQTESALS